MVALVQDAYQTLAQNVYRTNAATVNYRPWSIIRPTTATYGSDETCASNIYHINTYDGGTGSTASLYTTSAPIIYRKYTVEDTPTTWRLEETTTGTINYYTDATSNVVYWPTKVDKRAQLKQQHRVQVRQRGRPSFLDTLDPAEIKALQLLKSLVDAENFRRYLKYGFVSVLGISGLVYNIYRRGTVRVLDNHQQVASLCIHIKDGPPTDEVIAKVLMAECDEPAIWAKSNKSQVVSTPRVLQIAA